MGKILIIDDMEFNRELLTDMLGDKYEIIEAADGEEGLEKIKKHKKELSAILLDIVMPKKDGIQVLREMAEIKGMPNIPVLVISAESKERSEAECFRLGVVDFIERPFNFEVVNHRVRNVVQLNDLKNRLADKVAEQTKSLKEKNAMLKERAEKLKRNNENLIGALGAAVEARSMESGEHIFRVREYTRILAEDIKEHYPEYGLTDEAVTLIVTASPLHDVGKIKVPDAVLLKPAKLTADEWETMKNHTVWGCEILEGIRSIWEADYYQYCYDICRHHHERWTGKGYPDGLAGDDIPIAAQIVALADVFDAMVNDRVYKKAFPRDVAYEMITNGECGVFNPKIMDSFSRCFEIMNETVK